MKLLTALAVAYSFSSTYALDNLQKPLFEAPDEASAYKSRPETLELELRHIFHRGSSRYPDLHRRLDINRDSQLWATSEGEVPVPRSPPRYPATPRNASIGRLIDRSPAALAAVLEVGATTSHEQWTVDEVEEPD